MDSLRPGWQSLAYFHDVVQVAAAADQQQQQQAAVAMQSCNAHPAAAVGAMLLLERHSIFYARQHQQWLLLVVLLQTPQTSEEDWSAFRLNQRISNQPVQKELSAALCAKDDNELANMMLYAARLAQEVSPGSKPLLLKSSLPPAVDSPAARAAYEELFANVFSRVPAGSTATFITHAAFLLRGIWLQVSGSGRLSAAALRDGGGYQYAVSQLHVRSAASSPAVAELLLGSSALDESCLRWVLQLRRCAHVCLLSSASPCAEKAQCYVLCCPVTCTHVY
jgi:hypothetical protein